MTLLRPEAVYVYVHDHDDGNEHVIDDVHVVVDVVALGAHASSVLLLRATEHAGCVRSQV
jgi:hypothetical protein